jgi:3,4-dihydroxy 2-butanone 4-phosphate synthase/GTP cyclohydrolase II
MRRETAAISPISEIIAEIRAGNIVVLVDDEDRENEGDLVFAADFVTAEKINFLATHGRGLICMPITEAHAARLGLKPMVAENRSRHGTNFTVSIEAAEGIATGISAHDRALTVRVAASPEARASDIVQPGHVFPLIAQDGGVLVRAGHTEACCDLARLAGLTPAAVLCEIMRADGSMARLPDLVEFAGRHGLKVGTIADLIHYRSANESLVRRIAERDVDTAQGRFRMVAWRDTPAGGTHIALARGAPRPERETLVRVHEPLSVLDLLDAGPGTHSWSIAESLAAIAAAGEGVIVLLNCGQSDDALEARLGDPAQAAARHAGRSVDLRTYGIGAQILRELGVGRMRLMAAPRKMPSMAGFGLEVTSYAERAPR